MLGGLTYSISKSCRVSVIHFGDFIRLDQPVATPTNAQQPRRSTRDTPWTDAVERGDGISKAVKPLR